MSITSDANDPNLKVIEPSGMQKSYLVLSEAERAQGFVRPVRVSYRHVKCGTVTTMGRAIAETYARNPKFYGGTYCCECGTHYALDAGHGPQFFWMDGEPVGSTAEEAQKYLESKAVQEAIKHAGSGI